MAPGGGYQGPSGGGVPGPHTHVEADITDLDHYGDGDAVAAMGIKGDANPLNHDKYEDATAILAALTIKLNEFVIPDGDINLNAQKIVNLLDPTSDQEAATKKYVDDAIAAGGGGGLDTFTTAALAEVESFSDDDLYYVVETETLYRCEADGGDYTRNGTSVLNTSDGGNYRGLGIAGKHVAGSTIPKVQLIEGGDGYEYKIPDARYVTPQKFTDAAVSLHPDYAQVGAGSTQFENNRVQYMAASGLHNGNFVISYAEDDSDDGMFTIVGPRKNIVLSPTTFHTNKPEYIASAVLNNGNFVLIWKDPGFLGDTCYGIWDQNGNNVVPVTAFITDSASGTPSLSVTALNDGGFVLLFEYLPNGAAYLQKYDEFGNTVGGWVYLGSLAGDSSCCTLQNGNVAAAMVYNNGYTYYKVFDQNLNEVKGFTSLGHNYSRNPKLCPLKNGHFMMVAYNWSSGEFYYRTFDGEGENEVPYTVLTDTDPTVLGVVPLPNGDVLNTYRAGINGRQGMYNIISQLGVALKQEAFFFSGSGIDDSFYNTAAVSTTGVILFAFKVEGGDNGYFRIFEPVSPLLL